MRGGEELQRRPCDVALGVREGRPLGGTHHQRRPRPEGRRDGRQRRGAGAGRHGHGAREPLDRHRLLLEARGDALGLAADRVARRGPGERAALALDEDPGEEDADQRRGRRQVDRRRARRARCLSPLAPRSPAFLGRFGAARLRAAPPVPGPLRRPG